MPNTERIPLKTLRKLSDFVQRDGVVIATHRLLECVPGFKAKEAEQTRANEIVQRLFHGTDASAHFVADDKATLAVQLSSLFPLDAAFAGDKADLGFVHRHMNELELYFVANTGPLRCNAMATFRVKDARAEFWDPLTGEVARFNAVAGENGGTMLPLELEPYESKFIVFIHRGTQNPLQSTTRLANIAAPFDLSSGWQVSFGNGETTIMDQLCSWTGDEPTRYYSGRPSYKKSFEVSPGHPQKDTRVLLDFGSAKSLPVKSLPNGVRAWIDSPVCDAALVFLNGERIGSVWHPPYSLDVTRTLRPGVDQLKIIVGNTAINRLAGTRLPDYTQLIQRYGERFKPKDMDKLQPLPSGLTGPIRLISVAQEAALPIAAADANNSHSFQTNTPAAQTR